MNFLTIPRLKVCIRISNSGA